VRWERQDILRKGLEELGDPCKTLLTDLFRRGNGEGYGEIAKRLGISIGSVGPTRGRDLPPLVVPVRMLVN